MSKVKCDEKAYPKQTVVAHKSTSKKPQIAPKPVLFSGLQQNNKCHNKFLPKLNRKEAEQKLAKISLDGCYVLRGSDDNKYAAKVVVVINKCLYHFHIRNKSNNKVCLGMIEKSGEHNFDSIDQLINYYSTHQLVLINRSGHRLLAMLTKRIL